METINKETIQFLFESLGFVSEQLPESFSWLTRSAPSVIAILIIIAIIVSVLDFIYKKEFTKASIRTIRYLFVQAKNDAFKEPELKGIVTELPRPFQKAIFFVLSLCCWVTVIFMFAYSFVFYYPMLAMPYSAATYGIFSYIILGMLGLFLNFIGILHVGFAHQFLKLKRLV